MLFEAIQRSEQPCAYRHYITDDAGSTALDDPRVGPQVEHGVPRLSSVAAEVLRAGQHVMMRFTRPQRTIYEYEMSQSRWFRPRCPCLHLKSA